MKHKKILLTLGLFLGAASAQANCVLQKQLQGQKYYTCQAPGTQKAVHVLDLQGGFAETAYYHGYFLRQEIEQGVLKGIQVRTQRAFAELDEKDRENIELIKKCVMSNYRTSVSREFEKGLKNMHRGLRDAGSKVDWKTFEESNFMVEFSIYSDSMKRHLSENSKEAQRKIFASCAPFFVGKALTSPFRKLAEGLRSLKMGCTGISASASSSMDGALIHGRNFDTGLLSFYEPAQLILINRQKNGITSVGIASPGLHYAGGISGFNNQGLSGSLHELQTEGTVISHEQGSSDVAPYLLHSVLMQARTLDQAIAILKERKGFGAWTFLISDAKTDESASIELSGDTVVVARRTRHNFMGQSNHFIAPATSKEGYEYSLNKTLETRARLNHVNRTLTEDWGSLDFQWVINRLTGHFDELVGPRSFGRTTTKLYTAGTHVMIPARQEWWMSLGETYPTNRSHFVGFRLSSGTQPVEIVGVTKAWEDPQKSLWYDSMKYYIQAYLSNEQDHKTLAGLDKTLSLLQTAATMAQQNEIYEFPYHFMWARIKVSRAAVAISQGRRDLAYTDLLEAQDKLNEIEATVGSTLHPYEQFQIQMWRFRAETLKPRDRQVKSVQTQAQTQGQTLLADLIQQYPRQKELYDLRSSLRAEAQLPLVLDAEIRLGTVE
ncbi:MAG: C45 family autoproteolytic acyltransferase/hydrolase [Bdellovibrio sp.]